MARWVNYSGTTVNLPVVGGDVHDGSVVDVPDDVILPGNYFRLVDVVTAVANADLSAPILEED